ncbi:MAG: type I methionyl aminopeptidase [Ruminococcaceae bacterium]|nr:type I methionyl aminopeptidase [Oscillospiraceae bacterium]
MIILKSSKEIMLMKAAGLITARALEAAGKAVRPGVTTWELDKIAHDEIIRLGAIPSCLGYDGFPNSTCISVNNKVIHGIPSRTERLKEGDIVSIDLCACIGGFHGDSARTFPCGEISDDAKRLLADTEAALWEGISKATAGNKIGDIGSAVQQYVETRGYSVVREFTGHGVGASMHEEPSVPNYGRPGRGARLSPGMVIAIEPMVNMGTHEIEILEDEWTVVTADGKLSAHFEHTVAITENGPVILTALE